MAKTVEVALIKGGEWKKVDVPNFYDPEKHHTVRFGAKDKQTYAAMKMPDGKIYDKILGRWGLEKKAADQLCKLNLGCGPTKLPGYVNIDTAENADLVIDLEDATLPFADDSVTDIQAHQVLEHIHNFIPLMNEIYRVLAPNCTITLSVPVVPFLEAFQDPTHIRFFTQRTFCYFHEPDWLWQNVGKGYGIKPFRFINQRVEGWNMFVSLRK